jgi:hypothetical protein
MKVIQERRPLRWKLWVNELLLAATDAFIGQIWIDEPILETNA